MHILLVKIADSLLKRHINKGPFTQPLQNAMCNITHSKTFLIMACFTKISL